MYRKISKTLLEKIINQKNNDHKIDVIIRYNKDLLTNFNELKINDYIDLPFINSIACAINFKDLYRIAGYDFVNYISSSTKVSSLIYNAKKVIDHDNINYLHVEQESHSCVIIDTGIYPHVDFCLGRNKIIKFLDLINNYTEPYDDNGHGTFVSGILSGCGIVDKYSGIDNTSNIIVIKALNYDGETTTAKILEGMQWVLVNKQKYNIKIVCMSFGSVVGDEKDPLVAGVEVLWDNDIIVVAAAGNNGPQDRTIMSPGASKKVITVGSLDSSDINNLHVADFSSRGPVINYYKPDIIVPGVDIISTNVFSRGKKFYTSMSGTSVSTPIVAGVASLLLNYNVNYTPDQIKFMLINSTIQISGDRNSEGYGYLKLSKLKLI